MVGAAGFPVGAKDQARQVATFTARAPPGKAGAAELRALRDALAPEARGGLPGATIAVRTASGGGALEIKIEADSLKTLRAAVNSTLRAAGLAIEVAETAGKR